MTFTGIVRHVQPFERSGSSLVFDSLNHDFWEGVGLGDSIAVNGVCLTVAGLNPVRFDLAQETINLCAFRTPANLEKALLLGDRVGGHTVSGHVNAEGSLHLVDGEDWWFRVSPPEAFSRLSPKGSIAIDGISLTVATLDTAQSLVRVAIIPHTLTNTNLKPLSVGDRVNVEVSASSGRESMCVVYARNWHWDLLEPYVKGLVSELGADEIPVPGAFEIPLACKQACKRGYRVVVAVGLVMEGETYHFRMVADTVAHGIMSVQLDQEVPIANGVLACYTRAQAQERLKSFAPLADCARQLAQ